MSYSRLKPRINDLESYCKKNNLEYILKEWDYSNNNGLLPSEITYGSNISINWICDKNHPYPQEVNAKVSQRQGCPYCAGKKVLPGFNDLESYCKKNDLEYIIKEWSDNNELRPTQVVKGATGKFLWKCLKCGHEWPATLSNRIANKSGCPACAGKVVIKGINDLASNFPLIASEWDWEKNDKTPEEYAAKSHKSVYWKCPICGHSYPMVIQNRTDQNQGCPLCAKRFQSSFPEQAILYYVKKSFPDAVNKCREVLGGKYELDVYIPSKKIGIEYDGARWHDSSSANDMNKYIACKEAGIKLIRVCEKVDENENAIADKIILSNYNQRKNLSQLVPAIEELMAYLGIHQTINVEKDDIRIREQYYQEFKENSAGALYPELLDEWYQEENGSITLFRLSPKDDQQKYSWKCSKCGNVWKTTVYHRAIRGQGCRKCGYRIVGRKISKNRLDKNGSLHDRFPEIAKEWDYSNNGGITPRDIAAFENKKRYWICPKCKKSYDAKVSDRITKNTGCRYCAPNKKRKVICIETGNVYDSIRQAKLSTGFSNIERCVRGEGKTAGGYHWKFYDESD